MANVERIIRDFEKARDDRSSWENHWQEIADRVFPRYSHHFNGNKPTPGEKRTSMMTDPTATLGNERFAAAMESMLTPRTGRWHLLKPSNRDLLKDREVSLWFERKTDLLFQMRYAPYANFASQQNESYMQMGAFGTGVLFTDQALNKRGFRYRAMSISGVFFVENFQGIIDKAYRKFEYTAEQAMEHFGPLGGELSKGVHDALEKDPQKKFDFIHAVIPNSDLDPYKLDFRGKEFSSVYIELDARHQVFEDGYDTFPYAINRYVTTPGEVYGRSPAMLALPSIKTLNLQKEHVLMQGERTVRPSYLTHDDGIINSIDLRPGSLIPGGVSPEGRKMVQMMDYGGNLAVGFEMMDQERRVINDAFLVSLFQILTETPTMTATEVLERAREKGALLSPTMGRQQSEALSTLIEREMSILQEQGFLDDMPPALIEAEGEYEIVYDSPLTRSMKAEEAAGLSRYMELAAVHSQLTGDPSMMDWIDPDTVGRSVADIFAVPASYMRDPATVEAVRNGRAEAAQAQQMLEAAPSVAGLIKGLQ